MKYYLFAKFTYVTNAKQLQVKPSSGIIQPTNSDHAQHQLCMVTVPLNKAM